jgi:hypothetical protein
LAVVGESNSSSWIGEASQGWGSTEVQSEAEEAVARKVEKLRKIEEAQWEWKVQQEGFTR